MVRICGVWPFWLEVRCTRFSYGSRRSNTFGQDITKPPGYMSLYLCRLPSYIPAFLMLPSKMEYGVLDGMIFSMEKWVH